MSGPSVFPGADSGMAVDSSDMVDPHAVLDRAGTEERTIESNSVATGMEDIEYPDRPHRSKTFVRPLRLGRAPDGRRAYRPTVVVEVGDCARWLRAPANCWMHSASWLVDIAAGSPPQLIGGPGAPPGAGGEPEPPPRTGSRRRSTRLRVDAPWSGGDQAGSAISGLTRAVALPRATISA
jgi:hypothetical protein